MRYREYDTEIFYRKDSGELLYIANEISGAIVEQERPTINSIALQFGMKKGDVKSKIIKNGEFIPKFGHRQLLAVNPDCDKLVLSEDGGYYVVHYNAQMEKHDHTLEEVLNYYHDTYLFNLAQVLKVKDLWFEWATIDQMDIREETLDFSWFNYFDDGFVTDSFSDRSLIARDILANGTFWPLVVQKVEGGYIVFEGNHRIISAKILQQSGEWDNRKMLCLVTDCPVGEMKGGPVGAKRLPGKLRVRAPFISKFPDLGYINEDNAAVIQEIMTERNMVFVDDKQELVEYDIYTYSELMQATQVFPHWLRDLFYNFREQGHQILGHDVINSEAAFEEWRTLHV